jgi:hypothetical protein
MGDKSQRLVSTPVLGVAAGRARTTAGHGLVGAEPVETFCAVRESGSGYDHALAASNWPNREKNNLKLKILRLFSSRFDPNGGYR